MASIKTFIYLSLLMCPLFSRAQQGKIPSGAIKGDFDGDGKQEYVWIVKPKLNKDQMSCMGPCIAYVVFSNPHIKSIKMDGNIGGKLTNLGDLNNDGRDDIGVLPEWFTSCWRSYFTYTLKNGSWQYLVQPFATHCNQWEDNVIPLEKIPGKAGYLKENYSTNENGNIVLKSKIVRIN